MENAHCVTTDECCKYFSVNSDTGLSDLQIKENQAKYGPNGKMSRFSFTDLL